MDNRCAARLLAGALVILGAGGTTAIRAQSAGKIYMTFCIEGCGLKRANLDGTNEKGLISSAATFAIDLPHETIYFGGDYFSDPGTLRRCSLDGAAQETLISGLDGPLSIAVDPFGGKVYFVDSSFDGSSFMNRIRRANLDGSVLETLVTAGPNLGGLDVETIGQKLYWTNGETVRRANLDGSDEIQLFTAGSTLRDIVAELPLGLFVTAEDRILRATVSGFAEAIITPDDLPGFAPSRIAVDPIRSQIYFTAITSGNQNGVWRANADGSSIVNILPHELPTGGLSSVYYDLDLALSSDVVPASSAWSLLALVALLMIAAAVALVCRRGASAS